MSENIVISSKDCPEFPTFVKKVSKWQVIS